MLEKLSGPNVDKLPALRLRAMWVGFKKFYEVPPAFSKQLMMLNYIGFLSYGRLLGYAYMPMTSNN